METKAAAKILAALAQESRLNIFRRLVAAGPEGLTPGRLGEALGLAPATLSFHLKGLVHAGLITARQESRFIFYAASYPTMNDLIAFLTANCCEGRACEVMPAGASCQPKRRKASR